jgi:thymidylate kinase
MQLRVRQRFRELQALDEGRIPWKIVNAAQSMDQVEEEIFQIVQDVLETVRKEGTEGKPLQKL